MAHHRRVDDALSAVGPTAAWAEAIVRDAGLSEEARHDLHVCLEEALANLILHGRPVGGGKQIGVEIEASNGAALLTITDRCAPFDLTEETAPVQDEERIGGHGLRLLRAFASDLAYSTGPEGNSLRMRFGAAATDIALLRRIPTFAETPEAALAELLSDARSMSFAAGERLLVQGEPSEFALILTDGEAAVINESAHGEAPVARIAAPALVGEIGALSHARRTASVRALTPVSALKIGREALLLAGEHYPDMLVSVIRHLGQHVLNINTALGLYAAGLSALERDDFDPAILSDLSNPSDDLNNFATAFRKLADRVTHERRSRAELASAALIQRAMLPPPLDADALDGRCDAFADIKPARDVGGDLFDLRMLDERRLAIVVGDVCGKGVPASLFMCATVTALRLAAEQHDDLTTLIERANDALCAQNAMSMFATLFYGVLDLRSGQLSYVNCGHNAPLLIGSGESAELPGRGPPFGFFPGQRWQAHALELKRGEGVFLFTDGVTESMNLRNEEYGDTRLADALRRGASQSAAALVSGVMADAIAFADGAEQADDITCLAALLPR